MRKTLLPVLLTLGACASGPAPRSEIVTKNSQSAETRLAEAKAMATTLRSIAARARKGEAGTLRDEYLEQARQRPNDWKPRLLAAWTGAPTESAWQDIAKVCKLNPEEPWPWTASGLVYLQWRGFLSQAELEFGRALKAQAGFVPARVGLADVLRLGGKLPEAKAAYEAILVDAPDWQEALSGLGLALAALKDPAARPTLEKALALDPDDLPALTALARLALEAKDTPKVIELYSRMLQFNQKDREAHLALAKMKADSGDGAGAATSYETAMSIAPDAQTARTLAALYQGLKRTDDEVKALEKVAQLDTKDPAPFVRIAEIRKGEGDTEGAETAMRQATDRSPDDADLSLALARIVGEKDDLIAAIEEFRVAKGKGAADAEAGLRPLEAKAGLGKPITGDANRVYGEVFARLNKSFQELSKANPALGGKIRARVTIGADGRVAQVDMLEDTVHEGTLTALVYFSLKDAVYPKKGTPTFEFVLNPASGPAKKK